MKLTAQLQLQHRLECTQFYSRSLCMPSGLEAYALFLFCTPKGLFSNTLEY